MYIYKVVCPGHPETPVAYSSAYPAALRAFQELRGSCNVVLLVRSDVDMCDIDFSYPDGRITLKT